MFCIVIFLVSRVFSRYKIVVASQVIYEKLCLSPGIWICDNPSTRKLPAMDILGGTNSRGKCQRSSSFKFNAIFFYSEKVSIFMLHSSIPLVPSPIWVYNSFNIWSLTAWQVKTTTTCWYYLSVFNDLLSHSVSVHHVLWWFFNNEMYMFASLFFWNFDCCFTLCGQGLGFWGYFPVSHSS